MLSDLDAPMYMRNPKCLICGRWSQSSTKHMQRARKNERQEKHFFDVRDEPSLSKNARKNHTHKTQKKHNTTKKDKKTHTKNNKQQTNTTNFTHGRCDGVTVDVVP